jgi:hypothetical protein
MRTLFLIPLLLLMGCPRDRTTSNDDDDSVDEPSIDPALEGWCQIEEEDFSFFVTSMAALWALSGDDINDWEGGFGGNFGGLEGADEICQKIATATGNSSRTWKAFLSATDDGNGNAVHAIERIGEGPWHDANGRLVASGIDGMLDDDRPDGDDQSVEDLPDECGVGLLAIGDAHDVVTGSDTDGRLNATDLESTCNDWTADSGGVGTGGGGGPAGPGIPACGHSFPREGGGPMGAHWISDHGLRGCDKGANLLSNGPGTGTCIGCTGGYGAVYCFAGD